MTNNRADSRSTAPLWGAYERDSQKVYRTKGLVELIYLWQPLDLPIKVITSARRTVLHDHMLKAGGKAI